MKPILQASNDLLNKSIEIPEYRPPRWESPIEESLWRALRYIGISVDMQVPIGKFRVDMVVSSRRNNNKVIIECDGAEYHHPIIDDFRDDALLKLCNLPIAHVDGRKIFRSPEKCALFIVEHWFPEHIDTFGYSTTLEMAHRDNQEHYGDEQDPPGDEEDLNIDEGSGYFPIGHIREISGDRYPSLTDENLRSIVWYITGGNDDPVYENEELQKWYASMKIELTKQSLVNRELSLQELARAYIIVGYDEPTRTQLLEQLDHFLEKLALRNAEATSDT